MNWKDIKGYNGLYQISEYGDIKSSESKQVRKLKQGLVEITLKEKMLNPTKITNKNRYKSIRLCEKNSENKSKYFSIHKLVYESFIGDISDDLVINHIDFNRENNHYSNLEAVKQIENVNHYWNDYFIDKINETEKLCTKCNQMLSFDLFYLKSSVEINQYKPSNRHYRSSCKDCMKKINKKRI